MKVMDGFANYLEAISKSDDIISRAIYSILSSVIIQVIIAIYLLRGDKNG